MVEQFIPNYYGTCRTITKLIGVIKQPRSNAYLFTQGLTCCCFNWTRVSTTGCWLTAQNIVGTMEFKTKKRSNCF